jgi:fatty-acyl-CoA synthase
MSDTDTLVPSVGGSLLPTPNEDSLPRRFADFATFGEALDYAARGKRGFNFHDPRGNLARVYPFAELRADALDAAYRLIAAGIGKGDRVALIAETGPAFAALFCGCVYAGAWPVPLPLPTSFGGKDNYIDQIAVQMASAEPALLLYPRELEGLARPAAERQGCKAAAWEDFSAAPAPKAPLPETAPDDVCFLQYSSGSTRFPHGVVVTHRSLLANLAAHSSPTRFPPITSGPRISRADPSPGSILSAAIRVPRAPIRRRSVMTSVPAGFPVRPMCPSGSICRAGG